MGKKTRKRMRKCVKSLVNQIGEVLSGGYDKNSPVLIDQLLKALKFLRKL